MDLLLAIVTLLLLVLLVYRQVTVWRWRVLISPGFYFGVIWSFGVLGCIVFDQLGVLIEAYPQYINELNGFVAFTALCFLFLTRLGRQKVLEESTVRICYISKYSLFKLLSVLLFVSALLTFIRAGANFNMGLARERMHDNVANQSVLVGYVRSIALPLCIYAGSVWGRIFSNTLYCSIRRKMVLCLPLLANLLYSMYLGGRVDFVYGIIYYLIGFFLVIPLKPVKKISRKVWMSALLGFVVLNLFITGVSTQRAQHYGSESNYHDMVADKNTMLGMMYGPMEYVIASYVGYQYRRVDAVDLTQLRYGACTFNGFINWTLPFAGRFGLQDFSIAKSLGIYYDNQEGYDFERPFFYTTNSCYIPMVKDFGVYGTFLCILFLTSIAHRLFVKIQERQVVRKATGLFFYFVFFNYWLKSNFYGTLSEGLVVVLYGLLIIDFCDYLSRAKKVNKTRELL